MRTLLKPRWGIPLALALASCHVDQTTGARDISVTLAACGLGSTPAAKTCPATSLLPLQRVEVTATATPSGSFPVTRIVITAQGVISVADTFVPQSPGPGTGIAVDTFFIPPILGTVTFNATATGGSVSAASTPVMLSVADTVPPVVTSVVLTPHDSLEPGDSIYVDVTATDNAAVAGAVVRGLVVLAGLADTVYQFAPSFVRRAGFRVPQSASYGATVSFEVQAFDLADLKSPVSSSPMLTLGDYTPPVITGANANGPSSDPLVPGDTLRGVMDASDNHKLAWIGYRVGQPVVAQDSFAVTGTAGQYAFSGIVAQSWIGDGLLKLFARDSSGNLSNSFNQSFRVLDAVRKPVKSSGGQAGIQDMIYDAKRNTVYFMNTYTIGVLPVSTMTFAPPITLPTDARGYHMDLTPSSDSIVFANQVVTDSVFVVLATVDLTQPSPTVIYTHMTHDPANNWAAETGVASTNRAFVPILSMTGFGEVDEFDLATKTETRRNDAGESGNITTFVTFLPNRDHTRIAMIWSNLGQIYSVATDAFSPVVTLPSAPPFGQSASTDSAGAHYLLGGTLLDGNLSLVRTFNYPSSPAYPNTAVVSAIAPDGTVAYFSQTVDGTDRALLLKVRLSDNTVLQRILVPTGLGLLLVLPDGNTLIGVARDNSAYAVDLR
ncbi:MAG TPA: hypothetical protein VG454_11940 [Gemmatimonadales bacterium]|nr:hypothetical protein [Gemmatimonadales bacterium]